MNFLKKNIFLILILFLGFFLRFNYDTFISGYNFDEFAIISIAKLNFPFEILKASAIEDYHAPLYYLIAHFFCNLAGCEIILRILNIIFSLLNIYVFYKIGKLLLNKNFGLILALFLAVNHLQISITNFIKFYCLSFLLFSISIYYLIKFISYGKNEIKLALANCFFILSYTLGFLWVTIVYILLLLLKKSKKVVKSLIITIFGFILYFPILIIQTKMAFGSIISAHGDYPGVSFMGFYVFLNDYFTPLINYPCNVETIESMPLLIKSITSLFNKSGFDWISSISFILLSLIPVLIGIFGIINSIKNNKKIRLLLFATFISILTYLLLIYFEITGYIPIYQFSNGIMLIIIALFGIFLIKNKKLKIFLISYLIFSQLIITNVYPIEKREEQNKMHGNIDTYISKIKNSTPIIMIDAARFAKYYYKEKNIFPIDFEELQGSHSRKWIEIIYGEEIAKKATAKNYKDLIKPFIQKNKKSAKLEKYLQDELFSKINSKEEMLLIYNTDGRIFRFDDKKILELLELSYIFKKENSTLKYQIEKINKEYLTQGYLGEIVHSYSTKLIIEIIEKYFKPIKIEQFIPTIGGHYVKYSEKNGYNASINDLMTKSTAGWIFVTYQKQ